MAFGPAFITSATARWCVSITCSCVLAFRPRVSTPPLSLSSPVLSFGVFSFFSGAGFEDWLIATFLRCNKAKMPEFFASFAGFEPFFVA